MKDPTITFEVQRDGQKGRQFRFPELEITIGFNPHCQLVLEPFLENGPELRIVAQVNGPSILYATSGTGAFLLNGTPCVKDSLIKLGDVITSDHYRIIVRELPGTGPVDGPSNVNANEEAVAVLDGDRNEPERTMAPGGQDHPTLPASVDETKAASPISGKTPPAIEAKDADKPAGGESQDSSSRKPGLSYLYLFFAPVRAYLEDDEVSEVMINGPRQIYVERKGRLMAAQERFSSEQALEAAVMNVARSVGRLFDKDNPRLDARLPDGSRVHAVMPPLCRAGTVVAIRKFRKERLSMEQLIQFGSLSEDAAHLLSMVVKLGKNLIVSGATSSGKTSVLNVLSSLIPEHERILVLEDSSELQLQQKHVVCFETRKPDEHGKGEVSIRDLVHSALRLRPDRLVVGEIRGGEALDLLQAMNTGHDGSMSTIHANSARDSLFRLETCALLSGVDLPLSALREQIASSIHVVIQTARLHDGSRKITAITEVLGLKDREYQLQDILLFRQESLTADGKIAGRHVFTGHEPTFAAAARQRGIDTAGLFHADQRVQGTGA